MSTHVLLVEDNPTDRRMVQIALAEATGFEHRLATVGRLADAVDHLDHHAIDVVLLDLNLPDSQGLDTFTAIRDAHPDVPVIVLTGLADEGLGDEAIRAGAQDFLVKGKMFGELLWRAIRYAKERQRILQELREAVEKR